MSNSGTEPASSSLSCTDLWAEKARVYTKGFTFVRQASFFECDFSDKNCRIPWRRTKGSFFGASALT
jgi:hypothetical protein